MVTFNVKSFKFKFFAGCCVVKCLKTSATSQVLLHVGKEGLATNVPFKNLENNG